MTKPDAVYGPGEPVKASGPVCDSYVEACVCCLGEGHDGNHHCTCGGQWIGSDRTGDAVPKKLPDSAGPFGELLDALFGDPD